MMITSPKAFLRSLFDAAVLSAAPAQAVPRHVPPPPKGDLVVIGFGKASASMARAVEETYSGKLSGLVVTRYGHKEPCRQINVIEAGHPIPDAAGLNAAERILRLASGFGKDDLILCLISGGGSALLPLPAPGISLTDKQAVNAALLRCGASISEMNCVRRHLSAIKGGRLAAACQPAQIVNLIISDVPGDDPSIIASGPTVADPTTRYDALAIIDRYRIGISSQVRDHLAAERSETIKPTHPMWPRVTTHLIATPQQALEAAAATSRAAGVPPHILSDRIEGEAREVARAIAAIALQVAGRGQPFAPPCVLLCGGETTVTVHGRGQGGRNVEFLLSLAIALEGAAGIHALAADTDGIDGMAEVAGAYAGPETLSRARALSIDSLALLADNDGHRFFAALTDSVITGPTHTNVNDFRAILITAGD